MTSPSDPWSVGQWLDNGSPYTRLVDVYGHLVSASSEEFRSACEARVILALPTKDERNRLVDQIVRTRCRPAGFGTPAEHAAAADRLRQKLKDAVYREWAWRKLQHDRSVAAGLAAAE